MSAEYYIDSLIPRLLSQEIKVLDLGCGAGGSIDVFHAKSNSISWFGLDIENSSEVKLRNRNDASFYTFDGTNIPFEDNAFDLIYSNQVFEHVRYPELLLTEIHRVLKKDGYFIGSVSYIV